MDFEWDEAKRKSNLRKHGIDFLGCGAVFDGHTLTEDRKATRDEQKIYFESVPD